MASRAETVQQALAAGNLTVADPQTGYQRSIYANCPQDGAPSPVRRVERGSRHAITGLRMRCPRCGQPFRAELEALDLR